MTDKLPANILKLFAPRPPISYLEPLEKDYGERTGPKLTGIAKFVHVLSEPTDYTYEPSLTAEQLRVERKLKNKERAEESRKSQLAEYENMRDQAQRECFTSDPFRTIFVARIPKEFDQQRITEIFERYGPLDEVKMVKKPNGTSRGYAFVQYQHERDAKVAQREADGYRLGDSRLVVDVERGRAVKDWLPKRLGGGLTRPFPAKSLTHHSSSRDNRRGSDRPQYNRDGGNGDRYERRKRSRSPHGGRSRSPKRRDDYYRR